MKCRYKLFCSPDILWGYDTSLPHLLNRIRSLYEPKYYCYRFSCCNNTHPTSPPTPPGIRKASWASASRTPSISRGGLSRPPGAGICGQQPQQQPGRRRERRGRGGQRRREVGKGERGGTPGGVPGLSCVPWLRHQGLRSWGRRDGILRREGGGRDALGKLGGEGQERSVLEHPVISVKLGTGLSLNPFLIISSENRDMLVTGMRGKQNPDTGSFLLDNKHPVITT